MAAVPASITALQPHLWVLIVGTIIAIGYSIAALRIDIAERRLPNPIVAKAGVAAWGTFAMLLIVDAPDASLIRGIVTVAVIAGPLAVIWLASPSSIGAGDVKLAAALAPLAAWPPTGSPLIALAIMFVLAVPQALRTTTLAFGPYIVAGIGLNVIANLALA